MATDDPVVGVLDRAARRGRKATYPLVLDALERFRRDVTAASVRAALEQRSPVPIFELPAWRKFGERLADIFEETGPLAETMTASATGTLPKTAGVVDAAAFEWAPYYDRARDWLDREGARLVTWVSDQTAAGIRGVIQNAFAEPEGVRMAARKLLDIKGFGLNARGTASLERYIQSVITRTAPGSRDLSGKQIQRLIDVRYQKLRRDRALLVARTESYNAANAAQRELWAEAASQGQLDVATYELEWITRVIRVCPRCLALRGKRAGINGGTFTSDPVAGGGKWAGTVIVVERPTVHPGCFCALRVVKKAADAVAAAAFARARIVLIRQTPGWDFTGEHWREVVARATNRGEEA